MTLQDSMKVFNIARYVTINGLKQQNDIYIKIYYNLKKRHGVDSLFIKPVNKLPLWYIALKPGKKFIYDLYNENDYVDEKYKIPVKFFQESYYSITRAGLKHHYMRRLQFSLLGGQLEREISSYHPDLIHSHGIYPDGYYALKIKQKYNIPYIITLRGEYSNQYNKKIYKKILDNASNIHTPSYSLFENLKRKYPVELIPHPLEKTWFEGSGIVKYDKLRLITVSRLLKMKNIDVVLKAVKMLVEQGVDLQYLIVGDGPYRAELEQLTENLELDNVVLFKGYSTVEEMKDCYSRSNVFVLLSRPETYGRVYFEAAARGQVIVGAKGTGADGHLTSEEGFFINEDENELAELLKTLDVGSLEKYARRSQKKMDAYNEEKITNKYHRIIRDSSCLTSKV